MPLANEAMDVNPNKEPEPQPQPEDLAGHDHDHDQPTDIECDTDQMKCPPPEDCPDCPPMCMPTTAGCPCKQVCHILPVHKSTH